MRKTVSAMTGQLTRVSALYRGKERQHRGLDIIEGPQAVREALSMARERVTDVYLREDWIPEFDHLLEGIWNHIVPGAIMDEISADAQGIIAVLKRPDAVDIPARLADSTLAVLAAEMQDPGNAGTLIRSADGAGADLVMFGTGSVDITSPKVVRAAAGSTFHVPLASRVNVLDVISQAQEAGMTVRAADGRGATSLTDIDSARRCLWVIGNEARGLTDEIRHACDEIVAIPIKGRAESLNASIAAALCLYSSALGVGS